LSPNRAHAALVSLASVVWLDGLARRRSRRSPTCMCLDTGGPERIRLVEVRILQQEEHDEVSGWLHPDHPYDVIVLSIDRSGTPISASRVTGPDCSKLSGFIALGA